MSRRHPSDVSADAALRYTFPAAAGQVWLGLGLLSIFGSAVTIAASVLLVLVGLPLLLVAMLAAVGVAVSIVPAAGRPVLAWAPTLFAHLLARGAGAHRWTRPLSDPASLGGGGSPMRLGVGPRHCRLVTVPQTHTDPGAAMGGVSHGHPRPGGPRDTRVTVVLEAIGLGRFGLLDPVAQDTELARWGSSLATLFADPRLRGVQWVSHARPAIAATDAPGQVELDTAADPDGPDRVDLQRDYAELTATVYGQATRHRHLIALSVTHRPDDPEDTALSVARHAATVLLGADLLARPLSVAELGSTLRQLLDPAVPDEGPVEDAARWLPLATRREWDHCRIDDTVHRCYAVTGWPRLAVSADWLAPLLHDTPPAGTARTLSVHAHPVSTEHAARQARARSAKAHLDAADRHRLGFTATGDGSLTDLLAASDAEAAEAELAAGYRMGELSALLTVSAPDLARLETAGRQLRALAAAHRLQLRPLHGQHLPALAAALPLGLHPGAPR